MAYSEEVAASTPRKVGALTEGLQILQNEIGVLGNEVAALDEKLAPISIVRPKDCGEESANKADVPPMVRDVIDMIRQVRYIRERVIDVKVNVDL